MISKPIMVAVSWEKPDVLKALLESVERCHYEDKLLVVDNGSKTEETINQLVSMPLATMFLKENIGCPGALNVGFKHAIDNLGASHVIRCDNDIILTPGCLEEVVSVQNAVGGIVGPATNSSAAPWQMYPFDSEGMPVHPDAYEKGTWIPCASVTGFFTCYRAADWLKIGPFIDKYPDGTRLMRYMEDTEHCHRAEKMGYRTYVAPAAWVTHEHGASRDMGNFQEDRIKAAKFWKEIKNA